MVRWGGGAGVVVVVRAGTGVGGVVLAGCSLGLCCGVFGTLS